MKSLAICIAILPIFAGFSAAAESLFKKQVNGVRLYDLILKQDVPENALKRVFEFLDTNGGKKVVVKEKGFAKNRMILVDKTMTVQEDYTTIVDYSKPSSEPRLYLINLSTGKVGKYLVAHGRGSGVKLSARFSNVNNSKMSSLGLFLGGTPYKGRHGTSLKMHGLEATNSNATLRDIVIHSARYVSYEYVKAQGRLGRSWGCPAVSPTIIKKVISTMRDGSVVYGYHKDIFGPNVKNPVMQEAPGVEDEADVDLPDEEETERAKQQKKTGQPIEDTPAVPANVMLPAVLPPPRPDFEAVERADAEARAAEIAAADARAIQEKLLATRAAEIRAAQARVSATTQAAAKAAAEAQAAAKASEKVKATNNTNVEKPVVAVTKLNVPAPAAPTVEDAKRLEQLIRDSAHDQKNEPSSTNDNAKKASPTTEEDTFFSRWMKKIF